jgi:hypothetical protein
MGVLTKNNTTRRLLRTVNGKRHAEDDDHEGPTSKKIANGNARPAKETKEKEEEEDINAEPVLPDDGLERPGPRKEKAKLEEFINAEPMSSDDELEHPAPRPAQSSKPTLPTPTTIQDAELKKPQRTSKRKQPPIRLPPRGAYQKGQTEKAKRGSDGDEENATPIHSSEVSTGNGGFPFDDMAYGSTTTKKAQTTFGSKNNIHAAPSKNGRKTYGSRKKQQTPETDNDSQPPGLNDNEYNDLMKDVEDSELPRVRNREKRNKPANGNSKPTLLEDDELEDMFGEKTESPMPQKTEKSSKSARLLNKLNTWKDDQEPPSSQPDSSAPQEALENVSAYLRQLPEEEEEGTRCTLCHEPVDQEDYWEFWKGKNKSVKNKTAFCDAHKKKSAQEEYTKAGYPEINWSALPRRIRKHRMTLYQLLHNERPSIFRDRYEPLALTGKAATGPSRRKDLTKSAQEELESQSLEYQSTYPGYYGPHGRRAITENIMDLLKTEIKNCKDPVVQASGIAAFVQAVLVPDAAILLIMEDCTVDREDAERIREETYEMGLLLHEEIEDKIEVHDDESNDENEYQHR